MSDAVEEMSKRFDAIEFNANDELPDRSHTLDEFQREFNASQELSRRIDIQHS